MADNTTSFLHSVAADLYHGNFTPSATLASIIIASVFILPFLNKILTPRKNPQEPPFIKPSIPFIGHIIGILRHQNDYHRMMHKANPSKSIVTLPMLNGKLYSVWDPSLLQTVLRSKAVSFGPFARDFCKKTFGLDEELTKKVKREEVFPTLVDAIHASFAAGMLHKMNVKFLKTITDKMQDVTDNKAQVDEFNHGREKVISGGLEVENLFLWARDVMTIATTKALYGDHDPFSSDLSLIDDAWLFEQSIPYFLLSFFPSITMPKAFKARERLQAVLKKYYNEEHYLSDPTTSQLVKNRANALRQHNFTNTDVATVECILPNVATLNAIPTFYWLLLYIFARPELLARIRKEVEDAAEVSEENGKRRATLKLADFDEKLPLLVSCYRETMRLTNHQVGMRRVMEDTTITAADGQTYFLQAGFDIQLPAGVTHRDQTVWGPDAEQFNPERFLRPSTKDARTSETIALERARKAAYIPFGGGRHYCPGRNFAFAEIVGFTSLLVLGFEIEPVGMKFEDMEMQPPLLASGALKPVNKGEGLGGRILRREGWEDVEWRFEC